MANTSKSAGSHNPRLRILLALTRAIYELTLRFPYLFLKYLLLPSQRPHASWSLGKSLAAQRCRTLLGLLGTARYSPPLLLKPGAEGESFATIPPSKNLVGIAAPRSSSSSSSSGTGPTPVETFGTWYPCKPAPGFKGTVALHFHGGAYVSLTGRWEASRWSGDMLAGHMADFAFMPDYRLASRSDGAFPAQLQDAIAAYEYLLALGFQPGNIILGGDSAGAHLALSLLRYMAQYGEAEGLTLPIPRAAVLWSPAVNWGTLNQQEFEAMRNYDVDVLPAHWLAWGVAEFNKGVELTAEVNAYIVPLGNPFQTSVPLWIQLGGLEILHDDGVRFADEMRAEQGNSVTVDVAPLAGHDLFYGSTNGFQDDAELAFARAGEWIKSLGE